MFRAKGVNVTSALACSTLRVITLLRLWRAPLGLWRVPRGLGFPGLVGLPSPLSTRPRVWSSTCPALLGLLGVLCPWPWCGFLWWCLVRRPWRGHTSTTSLGASLLWPWRGRLWWDLAALARPYFDFFPGMLFDSAGASEGTDALRLEVRHFN